MNAILMLMLAADPAAHAEQDIVLLDFTASYCQPCQQMVPVVQRMEKDGYPIQKVDITEQHELSRRFRVERIPTFVLLVEGQETKRWSGLTAENELRREMKIARDRLLAARGETQPVDAPLQTAEVETHVPVAAPARSARTAAAQASPRSLRDVFQGMFHRDQSSSFEFPTVRAQDALPGAAVASSLLNAANSTVRIQVTSKKLQDVGTGTIIYSVPGQSLILTCAHLFVGQDESARIDVDVFLNGEVSRFPAKIVGGDHNADLAVIRIQNSSVLPFVSVNAAQSAVAPQQAAVSFGCDNGRVPTPLQTRVLKIDQYNGPSNLTCATDPVQGRSGGGLFDPQGHLLAVCSCADRENKEGLYMSQPAILQLMKKLTLDYAVNSSAGSSGEDPAEAFAAAQAESERRLMAQEELPESATDAGTALSGQPEFNVANNPASGMSDAAGDFPQESPLESPDAPAVGTAAVAAQIADPFRGANSAGTLQPTGHSSDDPSVATMAPDTQLRAAQTANVQTTAAQAPTTAAASRTRVTVLIDSGRPGGAQRMIVIPQATPWLLELLTGESATQNASVETTSDRRIARQ